MPMPLEMTVGVDPKLTGSGWAIARGREIVAAGVLTVPSDMKDLEGRMQQQLQELKHQALIHGQGDIATVIVEFPRVYPGAQSKGDPNHIVDLAGLACGLGMGLAGCVTRLVCPHPRTWKGTLPKNIHHERLRAELPRKIITIVNTTVPHKRHDVWDAVGLVHWQLKRTNSEEL